MKKIMLLSCAVLLASTATFAQLNLGLKAGLNYSVIKAQNNEFNESGILGYQAGVWGRFGKGFYVQPEVYLGTKGSTLTVPIGNTNATSEEKVRFTSVDVPVLFGSKIGIQKLNLRFMIGPSFQFNIDDSNSAFSQVTNKDFYKYKDFVTNLQGGAGIDVGNLAVDLRYETSMTDINKSNSGQRQNLIHLSLGFKIL